MGGKERTKTIFRGCPSRWRSLKIISIVPSVKRKLFWCTKAKVQILKFLPKTANQLQSPDVNCIGIEISQSKINSRWVAGPIGQTNRRPSV